MSISIIKSGKWLYGGTAKMSVDVISLNYDWWFELAKADDSLELNENPEALNELGVMYYVRFKHAEECVEPTWVDSVGYQTLDEAMEFAKNKVPSEIEWLP